MRKIFFTLLLALVVQVNFAQDAHKKDAVRFLEISGVAETYEKLTDEFVKSIPEEKQADFKKELKASIDALMDKMAGIYIEELAHEDIKAAIKFYETAAGKKLAASANSDAFMGKAQELSQSWGMEVQGIMMKYIQ